MATRLVGRIAVECDGEGDAVLMIHGLGGSSNVWGPLLPVFARHRTIRPDLPGAGRSHRAEGPFSIAGFVEAMRTVCAATGVERAHVVGHSLGTIVAFHLAAAMPKLVRSLTLFGPLLAPADPARSGLRARADAARRDGVTGMQAIADQIVQAGTSAETKARKPVVVAMVRELIMRQTPEGYAGSCEALADAQPADPAAIRCPTLLVTGDEDAIAPAQAVRQLGTRIAGARVEVLPRCGHWTTIEQPEACADLARRFHQQRMP
ncbi:MAG: alpha/beta fold hydrolase [Alphaproteobacteria bacterium]